MKRTNKRIALLLMAVAVSAAACGGSTPSLTALPTSAAASPQVSSAATPSASVASPTAASSSTSETATWTWSYGGSLPSGWTEDDGTFSRSENAYVEILTDRSLMAADCALGPQPGIGDTSADIVGALSRRPGLAATRATDIAVAGLDGRQIDFAIASGWKGTCEWWDDPKAPVVPLVGTFDDKHYWVYTAVTKGEQYRYVVLDAPGGRNVVIAITAVEPEQFEGVIAPAMNIIHGLQFHIRN